MTFTTKVNFYGPIQQQGAIKTVRADAFLEGQASTTGTSTIPTTRLTTTPDPTSADADDDFGDLLKHGQNNLKDTIIDGKDK